MLVFAFDRDWTVDVNPHPYHDAVPLEWVRHLAHETDHAVYAIGNQTLADEAAIPGVVDIVGRHTDDWDRWLDEKQPDGRYERFPARRERLALIADLHPNTDGYVVVDDLDLSDVDGWDHDHAWEFVPAVERGDIHPDLPWVREQATDEGFQSDTESGPMSHTKLSSYLEEYDDAPAYELTYRTDGERRTRLCYSISVKHRTVRRPAAAVAVLCTPVSPTADPFSARVDSIHRISTASPPASLFTASADAPSELSTGLVRLANAKPDAVSISSLLSGLDTAANGSFDQRQVLNAVRHVAATRPQDCRPLIPVLRSLLQDADTPTIETLAPLRVISQELPGDVAPATDEIVRFLRADDEALRREAARCLAGIAAAHPDEASAAVPALAALLDDCADGLEHAAHTLSLVAKADPEAIEPVTEALRQAIVDESLSDYARMMAIPPLGRVAKNDPSEAVDIVDELMGLLDAENPKLKNNAVGLIADVAGVHTDVVEPYVDDIAALLSVDDDYTRINASCVLARVAEDFPESVEYLTPHLIGLLTDSEAVVRKNVCWALGHLRAEDAEAAIEDRLADEPDEDAHARAMWALNRIQG